MVEASAGALAAVIGAIGRPDFMPAVASALGSALNFDRATFFRHGGDGAAILYADLGGGESAYARHSFRHNPMLAAGEGAFRGKDFFRPDAARSSSHVIASPDEELGFRTPGWPEGLEEIGLYMRALGGMVELSFYRAKSKCGVASETVKILRQLKEPLAAAFERHISLTSCSLPLDRLTARERQVLELVQAGLSSDAIATRLALSLYTVKDHRKAIFRKLGVASRYELLARA